MILCCAALWACASQKTKEEQAEDASVEAERLLFQANEAMDKLEPDVAEEKLKEARGLLDDPAAAHWPDHSFQVQDLKQKQERLADVKAEVARIRLEEAVKAQTAKVDELVQKLDVALKPLQSKDGAAYTNAQIDEAKEVRSTLIDRLNEGVDLEKRSQPYQQFAKSVAERLKTVPELLDTAHRAVAFNDGPIAASKRARELMDEASSESELAEKVSKLIEAKGQLERCTNGAFEVAKVLSLAKVRFDDGGQRETPKSLAASCSKRAKMLKAQIAKLEKEARKKAAPAPKAKPKAKAKKK